MSFDAWIVGFGLSALLQELGLVTSKLAYLVLVGVAILDSWLLFRFFTVQLPKAVAAEAAAEPAAVRSYEPTPAPVPE